MNYSYLTNMNYNAGIYIRLSQEDKDKKYESDSESVTNQKEILRDYCLKNGFNSVINKCATPRNHADAKSAPVLFKIKNLYKTDLSRTRNVGRTASAGVNVSYFHNSDVFGKLKL